MQAVLGLTDTEPGSVSAAVGFLSAPPGDPVADASSGGTSGGADAIGKTGEINGAAVPTVGAGLSNGSGNLHNDGEPSDPVERPMDVSEAFTANALLPEVVLARESFTSQARPASAAWDASELVTQLYKLHYNQLVRLAVMLVHDVQTAEEVVQDAFEAMHLAWRRLRDTEKALSYLRQAIVNRSRSVLRHRKVV